MASARIPEIIYRYSRYQLGATVEFLKQCDVTYGLNLMESGEMKEAIEQLDSELPKEDTSEFSFDRRTKDGKDNDAADSDGLSPDDLFERYEALLEKGLGDKTEEGQELRGMIRAYIEQEKLPVRVTRSTSNRELLDLIDEALENLPDDTGEAEDEPSPSPETEQEETAGQEGTAAAPTARPERERRRR